MSEMWFPSRDLGDNNRSSNVFPTHWWGSDNESGGDDEEESAEEFVLTMDAVVNLFRIISVCPADSLGMVLASDELDLSEEEVVRMILWCDALAEQLSKNVDDAE